MSLTASQTVLHLVDSSNYVRITQSYDFTPVMLKREISAGGSAERIALLYRQLLLNDANNWLRSLSPSEVHARFGKPRSEVTASDLNSVYGDSMKNTVEFDKITDTRQSCSFFQKFMPTMVCVTSWTNVPTTSRESSTDSTILDVPFSVSCDFISDVIATVSITPRQITFNNHIAKADAPYIRMVRDPVAFIMNKIFFGTKGNENRLYEDTGLTYLTSMEMRTSGHKEHLNQKIMGNQELKTASLGCNVYGDDVNDRIDRKLVYTDGYQTSQPLYDSLFYKDDGISSLPTLNSSGTPIVQTFPIPLMSTFANDNQALQTVFFGSSMQMELVLHLHRLNQLFVLEGRGKSYDPVNGVTPDMNRTTTPTVSMTVSYRYAVLPTYLQVILASSSSINIFTNNRIITQPLTAKRIQFATKTPIAYVAAFGLLNSTGLNKLSPVERAERWSTMTAAKKRVVSGPTIHKYVQLKDVKSAYVVDNDLSLESTSSAITSYTGPTIQAGSRVKLAARNGSFEHTFVLASDLVSGAPMIVADPAGTPPTTPTLSTASVSTSIVPVEKLAAGTLSTALDIWVEEQVVTKVTVYEENDILVDQCIEYSGANIRMVEPIDNRTLEARSLHTKSTYAPRRRGMVIHSFSSEPVGPNRESGYILPVVNSESSYTYTKSKFVEEAGIEADYDVNVVIGTRNVIQSKAGMIHPKFLG